MVEMCCCLFTLSLNFFSLFRLAGCGSFSLALQCKKNMQWLMMKDNRGENSVERCISGELSLVVNCPLWCLCLGDEMSLRDRAVKMGIKQGE